jgi:hypothetical protein
MLRHVISQKEFHMWLRYFANKDPDETEIQLANLTLMVAQGLGSKKAKFEDFLINKPTKKEATKAKTPDGILSQNEVMSVFAGIAIPLDG